jgi:putative FmdB family regulatory protein
MPIYEYAPTSGHCEECKGVFEVTQRMADAKLTACPTCGAPCERRISAVALGGNWSLSRAGSGTRASRSTRKPATASMKEQRVRAVPSI